jgi:Ca2+-binding RTX toxin-like protein
MRIFTKTLTLGLLILLFNSIFVPTYESFALSLLQTFNNPTPAAGDQFGYSVSVSDNKILIGAPFDDTGASNAGAAYLFDGTTGVLLQTVIDPAFSADDTMGSSVSVSGNNMLVGVPADDPVGVSAAGTAFWRNFITTQIQTFNNPTPTAFDRFGSSVSVSGNYILVGAPFDDTVATDSGAAYLFDSTGVLLQTFNNPTPAAGDQFGTSVSVSGNNILVGAPFDDTGTTDTGAVYLFDGTTGALQTFNNPTPAAGDQFGTSVSVSGNNILVGASGDDTGAFNTGTAYLFGDTYCNGMTIEGLIASGLYNVIDNRGGIFGTKLAGTDGPDLILLSDLGNHAQGRGGNDCMIGGAVTDKISGGVGDDIIYGNGGSDHITGRDGADMLFGGDGNDIVSGGPGNDSVSGDSGNDFVYGREEDDSLSGGTGIDYCLGGAGTDTADASCEISLP